MRSSRDRAGLGLAAVLGALVGAAACGVDAAPDPGEPGEPPTDSCTQSFLDYDNFGAPFVANWCRGCHASGLPADMRQHAPRDVNFDDHDAILQWADRIVVRATGDTPTMPPAGGPSDAERALLAEWIGCGAP